MSEDQGLSPEQQRVVLENSMGLVEKFKSVILEFHEEEESGLSTHEKMESIALALAQATAVTLSYGVCCREHFGEMVQSQALNIYSIGEDLIADGSETHH